MLTPALDLALSYLRMTLLVCRGRSVSMDPLGRRPIIIYSDASIGAPRVGGLRCGAVVRTPSRTLYTSFDIPSWVVSTWENRQTQITVAELIVAPILALTAPDILRDQDVFWFIDNQSALACLVKTSSKAGDLAELSLLSGLALAAMGARTWYDYVPSALNIADGLSRDGWADVLTMEIAANFGWELLTLDIPWHLFCTGVGFEFLQRYLASLVD